MYKTWNVLNVEWTRPGTVIENDIINNIQEAQQSILCRIPFLNFAENHFTTDGDYEAFPEVIVTKLQSLEHTLQEEPSSHPWIQRSKISPSIARNGAIPCKSRHARMVRKSARKNANPKANITPAHRETPNDDPLITPNSNTLSNPDPAGVDEEYFLPRHPNEHSDKQPLTTNKGSLILELYFRLTDFYDARFIHDLSANRSDCITGCTSILTDLFSGTQRLSSRASTKRHLLYAVYNTRIQRLNRSLTSYDFTVWMKCLVNRMAGTLSRSPMDKPTQGTIILEISQIEYEPITIEGIAHGGFQFTAAETQNFFARWGIAHRLSIKALLKTQNMKPQVVPLELRNTTLRHGSLSSSQIVFGRPKRSRLPSHNLSLAEDWQDHLNKHGHRIAKQHE
ncbi:unnamed protein product [Lepeophtheirus salmonis]|uniref:(salmon louse) hypothetical protein n=1 Tax=Lepeophtheirus salmonis TaxID=72036 RepID=A0A7R8CXV2_LEPSM|nr:unnamed protein product [Lepeophtheirus salmonis]CAF2965509.1 unnamed protein product [Lepeophtheirus salmonis]